MTDYPDPNPTASGDGEKWLADAVKSVQLPGAVLQWFGMLSLLAAILLLVVFVVSPDTIFQPVYKQLAEAQKDPNGQPLPGYKKWVQQQQLMALLYLLATLAGSFVVVIGGLKMKQMSGYGWAVAGAILAAVPCTNSCFCVGLPVGMWALVALFGADVKMAFARITAMGGLEAYDPTARPIDPV